MNEKSNVATAISEIRGNMSDREFSEALNAFTNGEYNPSSNSLQKYRKDQRSPSIQDFETIISFGQKYDRISPSTSELLAKSFGFQHIPDLIQRQPIMELSGPQENVQIPIISDLTSIGEEKNAHLFIDIPKSLLFRRDENGNEKDYIWLTISDDSWKDVDILTGDLVLISKYSDVNGIRNNSRVIVRLSNEVVCKTVYVNMDARIILLPATPDFQKPIDPSTIEFIGIVEKVLRSDI